MKEPSTPQEVPKKWGLIREVARRAWGAPAVYLAGALLARIGSFLLIPIYTRRLTLEQYGDYALTQSIVTLMQTVLTAAFLPAISRLYFEGDPEKEGRVRAGAVAKWFVGCTLIAAVISEAGVLVLGHKGPGLLGRWELTCMVFGGAGAALAGLPYLLMRLAQRPMAASAFNFAQFLVTAGAGIFLVVALERGLRGAIEATGLSYALSGAVALIFVLIHYRNVPASLSVLHEALRFNLPLLPDLIVSYVKAITDRWVLKVAGLDAAVGEYAVANQIMTPATLVIGAWNDAEGVHVGELYRSGGVRGVMRGYSTIALGYLASAALPSIAIVAATPLLAHVVGKDFASVFWLLPFVGLSLTLESLYSPSVYVVYYASRPRLISAVTVATAVLHLALNFLFIPRIGIAGAIAARVFVAVVRAGSMWSAARRCARDEVAAPPSDTGGSVQSTGSSSVA